MPFCGSNSCCTIVSGMDVFTSYNYVVYSYLLRRLPLSRTKASSRVSCRRSKSSTSSCSSTAGRSSGLVRPSSKSCSTITNSTSTSSTSSSPAAVIPCSSSSSSSSSSDTAWINSILVRAQRKRPLTFNASVESSSANSRTTSIIWMKASCSCSSASSSSSRRASLPAGNSPLLAACSTPLPPAPPSGKRWRARSFKRSSACAKAGENEPLSRSVGFVASLPPFSSSPLLSSSNSSSNSSSSSSPTADSTINICWCSCSATSLVMYAITFACREAASNCNDGQSR